MQLKLERKYKKDTYTIGNLYINGKFFCNTIEDKDRGLNSNMSEYDIKKIKVYGETAIPIGKYIITLDVVSGKYFTDKFYSTYSNKGRVPRLLDVKGYNGILIHCGNTAKDSLGCILIGENREKGKVINSRETFKKLYPILKTARDNKESITIEIV